MPWRENKGVANLDGFKRMFLSTEHTLSNHRNLNGIYTEFFGGSLRLEIFGGNLL